MLTLNSHFATFLELHENLKKKLDIAFDAHDHIAVTQLAEALAVSSKIIQFNVTEETLPLLIELCGSPKVIECFGYENPCHSLRP